MKQKRSGVRILAAFLTALLLFYSLGTSVLAMEVSESGEIITEKMRAEEDPEECTEEKEALAAPVEEQSEVPVQPTEMPEKPVQPTEMPETLVEPPVQPTKMPEKPTEIPVQTIEKPAETTEKVLANNIGLLSVEEKDHKGNEVIYYEVTFLGKDGQELTKQFIAAGDAAVAPAAPKVENKKFVGWIMPDGTLLEDLSNVQSDMILTASYSDLNAQVEYRIDYVFSDKQSVAGASWVADLEIGAYINETIPTPVLDGYTADQESVTFQGIVQEAKTVKVVYTGAQTTYKVKYLLESLPDESGQTTYVEDSSETVSGVTGEKTTAQAKTYEGFTAQPFEQIRIREAGDTVVEIRYDRNRYKLTWDTGEGGNYIPEETLYFRQKVATEGKMPTRSGFDFEGWNLPNATMPAGDMTVTAKWKEKTEASYRIIYWKEKVLAPGEAAGGLKGYDYESSITGTGAVGTAIPDAPLKNYEGFYYNKEDSNVTITRDGTAVKNVYYRRNIYTITFYKVEKDGAKYKATLDNSLTIRAQYGQDVSQKWSERCQGSKWAVNFDSSTGALHPWYTMIANMPAQNIVAYQDQLQTGATITFYIEDLEGKRQIYRQFSTSRFNRLMEVDKQSIDGFTFYEWKRNKDSDGDPWLYYTRNSYQIAFENCGWTSNKWLKYEEKLENVKPKTAYKPYGMDEDYVFTGWYTSEACTEDVRVNWDEGMPSHDIRIFAGWAKPDYTVSFEANATDIQNQGVLADKTVKKYDTVTLPVPQREGDTFLGWYKDQGFKDIFAEGTKITQNITLYARWKSADVLSYDVVAKDENGNELYRSSKSAFRNETVNEKAPGASENPVLARYYTNELVKNALISREGQEIVFVYTKLKIWRYTVKYQCAGIDIETKLTADTAANFQTVVYKPVDGYQLASGQKARAVIQRPENSSSTGTVEYIFQYTKISTDYRIEHYLQNADGTYGPSPEEAETISDVAVGAYVQAMPRSYEGYTVKSGTREMSGAVKGDGSLTLKVYYDRKDFGVTDYAGIYDGESHSVVVTPTGIEGDTLWYQKKNGDWSTLLPEFEDAGTYWVNVKVKDKNGIDSPAKTATVMIYQAMLTVTTLDATKTYDGTPLTANGTVEGLVNGETVSFSVNGFQRTVGESKNTYQLVWNKTAAKDNYILTENIGTLKVTRGAIDQFVTLEPKDALKVYDGTPLETAKAQAADLNKNRLTVEYSADGRNWFTDPEKLTAIEVSDSKIIQVRVSCAECYEGYVTGTQSLTIAKCPITITADSGSKVFDGTPLVKDSFTITGGSLAEGEKCKVTVEGSQTDVGEGQNRIKEVVIHTSTGGSSEKDTTENYDIRTVNGTLTIMENTEDGLKISLTPAVKATATPAPKSEKKSEAPRTGDDTDIVRWLFLMAAAMAIVFAGVLARRHKNDSL